MFIYKLFFLAIIILFCILIIIFSLPLFLGIVALGITIILSWSKYECKRYKIARYTIDDIDNKDFTGLRIVVLADMHNCWFDEDNSSIIRDIKEYKPDIIVIAGDMIVCSENHINNNIKTAEFVNRLALVAPVYYGYGNHEMGVSAQYKGVGDNWINYTSILSDKVHLLNNEKITFEIKGQLFSIYGLNIRGKHYTRFKVPPLYVQDIETYIGRVDKNSYNILIAHHPDYFESYVKWGANLVLSGHNHGGLVRLPLIGGLLSPRLHIMPRFTYGIYKKNDTKMLLTNGLGAHSLKIRVNNIPEIVFLNINSTQQSCKK